MEREDFRMKENKMSRRSFLKAGAFASAAGMLAAAPAAANAAAPNAANAAEEETGLLGVFGEMCIRDRPPPLQAPRPPGCRAASSRSWASSAPP